MLINFSNLEKSEFKKPSYKKKKSAKNLFKDDSKSLTTKDIVKALRSKFVEQKYLINNAFVFEWESDFLCVSDSGYVYEIEIKVTRSDFKDDFQKTNKHTILESKSDNNNLLRPNKFFYAAPKGLLNTIEIPEYAGLIEITSLDEPAIVSKTAPFLHREKLMDTIKDSLLEKFYYRYLDLLLESEKKEKDNVTE